MRLDTHYQSIVGEMHMWRQLLICFGVKPYFMAHVNENSLFRLHFSHHIERLGDGHVAMVWMMMQSVDYEQLQSF